MEGQSIPVWVAVLIALSTGVLSGALGALGSSVLSSRHERREQWRARLLAAADDYLKGAVEVMESQREFSMLVKQARRNPELHDSYQRDAALELMKAKEEVEAHGLSLERIRLLFGIHSDVTARAIFAYGYLKINLSALPSEFEEIPTESIDEVVGKAYDAFHEFTDAANRAVRVRSVRRL